ncbi:MAG: hypothetical protein DRJ52_00795 [Thermoprotei archaeon]|nr:MAG: hypothetical protein DRJ52_00795 [Thermoprotei archaeon]RLF00431.1 MAG: hypothetical protein DRJ63_02510 [Thermoprotei archaeon]
MIKLPFFKKKKKPEKTPLQPSKEIILKSKPIRNPLVEWKKYESGEIALIVKMKDTWMTKLFKVSKQRKIILDTVGSFVWELCDGNHTIEDIINELCKKYKLRPREAEVSLITYLNMLAQRRLVAFIIPKQAKT